MTRTTSVQINTHDNTTVQMTIRWICRCSFSFLVDQTVRD